MADVTSEQIAAWKAVAKEVRIQERDGAESIDLSEIDDETLATAHDEEIKGYLDFIAEMSDSYSVTQSELSDNARTWREIEREAERRGL